MTQRNDKKLRTLSPIKSPIISATLQAESISAWPEHRILRVTERTLNRGDNDLRFLQIRDFPRCHLPTGHFSSNNLTFERSEGYPSTLRRFRVFLKLGAIFQIDKKDTRTFSESCIGITPSTQTRGTYKSLKRRKEVTEETKKPWHGEYLEV